MTPQNPSHLPFDEFTGIKLNKYLEEFLFMAVAEHKHKHEHTQAATGI